MYITTSVGTRKVYIDSLHVNFNIYFLYLNKVHSHLIGKGGTPHL